MRKRLKQIFSAALAGIVMCTAITFYPVEAKAAAKAATKDVWEGVSSADWMSGIDGSTKLSAINLPGTHDSTTKNVKVSSARCQNTTITEQLELGIRYLDMRFDGQNAETGKLNCVHSDVKCYSYKDSSKELEFQEVLDDCYAFLDKHPTETIVMRMKEDNGSIGDKDLQTRVHNYINKDPDYWYVKNGRPSLDETRGKIVLARYYSHGYAVDSGVGGLNFSGWPNQSSSSASNPPYVSSPPKDGQGIGAAEVWVQDWYSLSASSKWSAAQTSLNYAKTISNPDYVYFLNYLSSAQIFASPSSIAGTVNKNFLSYNMEYGANYGWVVMDFATEELAKHVYTSNKSSKLEAITATMEALSMPAIVESDMLLPTTGEEVGGVAGTSITWSCNPANALRIIGGKFTLVRQPSEQNVTLTATVSTENCSKKKEFTVQVSKLPETFTELGTAIGEAEAILDDPENEKYDLDSLRKAVEAARTLTQEDADKVSKTQIDAVLETLNAIKDRELALKSAENLREHLLAWYPLTAGSKDISGNHNNGVATGVAFSKDSGATFTDGGKKQSYISLPTEMFDGKNQLTISFWVKDTKSGTGSNTVFGFGSGTEPDGDYSANVYRYVLINTNNNRKLKAVITKNTWHDERGFFDECSFPANEWAHITCVFDGTKFALYKNGSLVENKDTGIRLTAFGKNTVAYIGNSIWTNNDVDYNGSVKDFRVYDCAVTPELIEQIYNDKDMDFSADSGHLIARYPLTADSKNVAGKGNDGVATGVTFSPENGATFKDSGKKQSIISLPTAMFDGEEQMTFSFWARDTKSSGSNTVFGIGSGTKPNDNGTADVFKYMLINTNYTDRSLRVIMTKNTWHAEKGFQNKECSFPANEWVHITSVFDGTKITLYKNGTLIKTQDTNDTKLTDIGKNTVAYIGNSIWTNNDVDYSGSVKDFRIYDCALSEAEAKGLMNESIKDEVMESLMSALDLDITKGEDGSLSMSITDAITLPTTVSGGTISWNSDKTNVIDNTGKVTLPAANEDIQKVTLTATVTINGKTTKITFYCEVFTKREDISTVGLQAVIASVETATAELNEADYTASSWKAYQDALATAKQQIKKPTSEEDVKAAADDLQNKKNAFVNLGNKTDLNALINDVKSLKQAEYTTASWTAFKAALTAAEDTAKSNDVSQADVNKAKDNLKEKKEALVKRGDKTKLNAAVAEAEALEQEDYTTETWTPFKEIFDEVKKTAQNIDATEEEVKEAEQSLDAVVKALKKITYTVTFKPDNGSNDITETVERKDKVSAPPEPEKDGYIFDGWFEENADQAFDVENTPIMSNVTLTAKWAVKRTVTFDPDNDTNTWKVEVKDGGKVTKPGSTPQKEGYGFVGWYVEGETAAFDFRNTAITADITLKAKWTEGYTVTFDPDTDNDNDIWTEVVKVGEKATMPSETPEKEGYAFEYWYAENEDTEFDFANTAITKDTTLKAKWTKLYKVTFNPDNDTDDAWIEEVKVGELVSEPEDIPEKEGYEFEGWYAENEDTEFDFANTAITKDITLKAKWTKLYKVTFNPDNDTDDTWIEEVKAGEMVSEPDETPEKEGYEFEYWYAEGETAEFDFANTAITANTTLKAKWTKLYTVTFNPDNGSNTRPVTVKDGEKVTKPDTPEKEDYEFEYWYVEGEETEFDFENTSITANITLIAKWKEKETSGNTPTLKPTVEQPEAGKFNVNIPADFAPDKETDVAIAIPDSLADDIKNCTEEQVFVEVNIPDSLLDNENINWTAITLPKEVLEAVKSADKELTVTVNGDSSYQWVFTAEELESATITDVNLLVEEDGAKADEVKDQLNDDEEGVVFSFAQEVPGSVIVDTEGMDWKPGDAVNLSYYNSETKELEQISGTYTVDANGKVTIKAPKAGSYVLWRKTAENEEPPIIKVKTLKINAKKLTLGGGEKFTLKVTINPKNATNKKVTWKSSNKKAATVSSKGVVTAKKVKKPAKTTITAKAGGKSIKCTVNVKPAPKKIALNAKSKTLKKGKTLQIKVKYTPKNAASYKLTYSIDKKGKKVVSVSSKGKIKAKKKGKATITVTTYNKKKATIKITVK